MVSFTETSFEASDSQLNVAEAQESQEITEGTNKRKKQEQDELEDEETKVDYQKALSPEDEGKTLNEICTMLVLLTIVL